MNPRAIYVVSDIHLGVVESTERRFRHFLEHIAEDASELVINGDLFDFWFEYSSVVPGQHFRVLAALADLRDAGVHIRFLGGNHDAWGGRFLRDHVGLELLPDVAEIDLGQRRALLVHGDGVGHGDLGYRLLKKVIRHPISVASFRILHPDLGARLARFVSTTESKTGGTHGTNLERAAALEEWAAGRLEEQSHLDLVLAGHTHTPTVNEVFPDRYYINTGDWINHFSYLRLVDEQPPELRTWDASAQGPESELP